MGVLGLDITTTPVGPDALFVDVRLPPPSRNWTTRIVTADSSRVQATRYQSRGFTRAADRTDTVPEAPLTRHTGRRPSTSNLYCSASSYSPRCNTVLPLSARVNPRDWYRVACTRDESAVTMRVVQFLEGGGRRTSTKSASGPTGVVVMSSPRTPMSVAGKLQTDGRLVPSTDQFNGVIDRVFLRIG